MTIQFDKDVVLSNEYEQLVRSDRQKEKSMKRSITKYKNEMFREYTEHNNLALDPTLSGPGGFS